MENRPGTIRKAAVSGTFYPSELCHLRGMVVGYLGEAEGGLVPGELIGLMVPHAGYIYSGKTAGCAYRQLENRSYDSIVLLGPSHFAPVNGIAVATEEAYETPLGVVSIDGELREKIRGSHPAFVSCQQAFSKEHSLEVQLPFLQVTAVGTPIVPLALHQSAPNLIHILAETLVSILSESKVLVIASSDLSHYYPAPIAEKLDRHALQRILDLDAEGLLGGIARNECQLCGAAGVAAFVSACVSLGNVKTQLLSYSHSGMITGDQAGVVGYGAVAFFK